jgi:geranylgeranylglycerol-phosphate geranylgeranyltransferase
MLFMCMLLKTLISVQDVPDTMASRNRTGVVAGLVSMMRLGNCVMGAAGVLLAAVICVEPKGAWDYMDEVILSMLAVVLFTGAGNSLNDYFDREVDRTAHPSRPIPRGLVSPPAALFTSASLFILSMFVGFLVGLTPFLIVVASAGVMVAYEVFLKSEGFVGNLAISWLTGALFLFGGAAVGRLDLAWILALLALLATLGREVVKDVQDMEGDRGSRVTLPMRIGTRGAGTVASAALVGAVLLSPVPYLLSLLSLWYIPAVVVADGIFIYGSLIHFGDPEKGQKVIKLAMLIALVAFLFGGIP